MSIFEFWYPCGGRGGSWNQHPADTEGGLYLLLRYYLHRCETIVNIVLFRKIKSLIILCGDAEQNSISLYIHIYMIWISSLDLSLYVHF